MSDFWALGIEIGGTKLQLGVGRGPGSLRALERLCVDPSQGAIGILDQIRDAFPRLLAKASLDRRVIQAAGVGFGGPVNAQEGRIQKSFQITGWDHFPLAQWIREELKIPRVIIENDADAAGLAEARFGAGQGQSPILYMTVGSGIGGALIVDRQIYRGAGEGATEIGHLMVPRATPAEGGSQELEHVASGWAIARTARDIARKKLNDGPVDWIVLTQAQGHVDRISTKLVADAARAGDPDSLEILDIAAVAVAFALSQAVTLLAPRRIVIGGGVSLIGETLWFEPIRRRLDRDVFAPFRDQFDVVPALLGEEVVVHGALALAHDCVAAAD